MQLPIIKVILRPEDSTISKAITGKNEESTLSSFSLNETGTASSRQQRIYTFSALVTDQIRDAITSEAITASLLSPRLCRFSKLAET
jgi:hypothetical protein